MGDLKNFSKLQVNTKGSHPEVFCKKMFLKILQISQKNVFAGVPFLIKLQAGNLKLSEAATGDVLLKKVFFKGRTGVSEPAVHTSSTQNGCFWTIHNIHSKKPVLESPFNKVAVLRAYNFVKEDSKQVLSREIYKLFKNNYFEKHLWNAASKHLKKDSNTVASLWILWIIQEF